MDIAAARQVRANRFRGRARRAAALAPGAPAACAGRLAPDSLRRRRTMDEKIVDDLEQRVQSCITLAAAELLLPRSPDDRALRRVLALLGSAADELQSLKLQSLKRVPCRAPAAH
jgi:hypothetical protein